MQKLCCLVTLLVSGLVSPAQSGGAILLKIKSTEGQVLAGATVELLRSQDSLLLKAQMTDTVGVACFNTVPAGTYFCRISHVGYFAHTTSPFFLDTAKRFQLPVILLSPSRGQMNTVTVAAHKPFIEWKPGKTIVNMESSMTGMGTTALEALEKLPGITVDKDGAISLKGRSGVTVMLDGKLTYLDASQLSSLLGGMSASQISQVEIMDQPSSQYDAAGNAGIINIKTKKTTQKGFNGSLTTSYTQGFYPKGNNSLQLNYRTGHWNFFLNYSANISRNFTRVYALRTYLEQDEKTPVSFLEQPSFLKGQGQTHTLRTGLDYSIGTKTAVGVTLSGLALDRTTTGNNTALWMDPHRSPDSVIETHSHNHYNWKNGGVNVNFRHDFTASRQLSSDVDWIGYRIRGDQFFENNGTMPVTYSEATRANIPSGIHIFSGRVDYAEELKGVKWENGFKTSHITTDNLAAYEYQEGGAWKPDLGKTNHFLYTENLQALYTSAETNRNRWTLQGGLRYEMTRYDAHQLGNSLVKDSAFSRSYQSLFPSFFASFKADSGNIFSLSAGRRIDRPPFQKLNPFLFVINKYTYQQGNPFYRPQYTWNVALEHRYREWLTTSLSYSITHDFFSQVFPLDSNGIVIYTEGNLSRLHNFGLSVSVQLAPASWWSVSAQALLNHKRMVGFVEKNYQTSITQATFNLNNQLRFKKGWSGELSGFYTSKSQNDIQEIVDPAGQLSIGFSRAILKSKGSLKLAARDLFYTQWMKGLTHFQGATEYFKLTRDSRVLTLSFSWRFGKAYKSQKRSEGAAGDEIQRVGNG